MAFDAEGPAPAVLAMNGEDYHTSNRKTNALPSDKFLSKKQRGMALLGRLGIKLSEPSNLNCSFLTNSFKESQTYR